MVRDCVKTDVYNTFLDVPEITQCNGLFSLFLCSIEYYVLDNNILKLGV